MSDYGTSRYESRYNGFRYQGVLWNENSEDHIARHGVAPSEVEEALFEAPRYIATAPDGAQIVFGQTYAGRYLVIVVADALDPTADHGDCFVVTAREQTEREKRTFRRKGR
ncbi:MAG: hypothetical protein QM728_11945 [Gordonia sp. (in: high G+C Gram-positive bacteria)]|uniref:hypothetical protein n=1 Tax=Gordonia sp. (in: high G+C Gram-positive bacteria) TaxID=84139 RepID=UPI0039E55520